MRLRPVPVLLLLAALALVAFYGWNGRTAANGRTVAGAAVVTVKVAVTTGTAVAVSKAAAGMVAVANSSKLPCPAAMISTSTTTFRYDRCRDLETISIKPRSNGVISRSCNGYPI